MTLQELAKQIKAMRDAQRKYFRDRSPQNLNASKDLERRLDQDVADVLDEKGPSLYDDVREVPK